MVGCLLLLYSWSHRNARTVLYCGWLILVLTLLFSFAWLPQRSSPIPSYNSTIPTLSYNSSTPPLAATPNNPTNQSIPTVPSNSTLHVLQLSPKISTLQVQRRPQNKTNLQTRSKYKSWKDGIVTKLQPELVRDCKKLVNEDRKEISKVKTSLSHWENSETDNDLLNKTSNCSWVEDNFLNNLYTTKLELSFPVAFVFVIYNSSQQVMRLLKLLYRPHNQYCISPDKKSGPVFIGIFRNLAKCLDNVHIVSTLREVQWGHSSIMESQMCCYKDLMKIREAQAEKDKWKYAINLCGKELPLTTNNEIVSHLVNLKGTSMVEAEIVTRDDYEALSRLRKPVPNKIRYAKSSAYMSLSPEFITYLLTAETAKNLFEYFKKNSMPEEHFFSTVYMLPNVPGGHNQNLLKKFKFVISRYEWIARGLNISRTRCHGINIHHICIVASGDLSWLMSKKTNSGPRALFHNKYFMENDHVIMDCMEERIVARNKLEYDYDNKSVL